MADLTIVEKTNLEKLFGMESGYVLDFTDRTFREFIAESVGQDIFDKKYHQASGSKANRLRAFWRVEPNHVVGKLLQDLIDYMGHFPQARPRVDSFDSLLSECSRTVERLRQGAPVLDVLDNGADFGEQAFEALERSLRQAVNNNEPESALDRLHTYVVKYMRCICERHGIETSRDKPLHSLVGEYLKALKRKERIESEMTERILKSSISLMEAFNHVRNEQTFAHDNPILNYNESLLIFNNVVSTIRFIQALEREPRIEEPPVEEEAPSASDDSFDWPF